MTRTEIEAKLLDYLMGEVTPAERREIEDALASDDLLRAKLQELAGTVAVIASARPEGKETLTSERREALLNAAAQSTRSSRPWWQHVAAAALFMSMGGGVMALFGALKNETGRAKDESVGAGQQAPLRGQGKMEGDFSTKGNSIDLAASGDVYALRVLDPSAPKVEENLKKLEKQLAGPEGRLRRALERKGIPQNAGFAQFVPDGEVADRLDRESNTEEYNRIVDNPFQRVLADPLSTFSIDVDTAAYANVRRFLNSGQLPPPDAARIEEMVNYFKYDYSAPKTERPFSAHVEVHQAPWEPKHRLVRIGMKGREIKLEKAPAANLVFLVDVSGSMGPEDRLPLVKKCLALLVENLREQDRVSLVVYAGNSGIVLPSTPGDRKQEILGAIESLKSGGSTNGGSGINLAYEQAAKHFIQDGVNRVILCTDGDFNVGVTNEGGLTRLVEEKRKTGVFLSVLGFGRGNYADANMQALADKGNGNAAYIDTLAEGKKVLVEQATGTLITIAKDVKIQVEFNPSKVEAYRLIGYENRMLAAQDFNDDTKDAGEIGAGHQVTALYEVIPAGQKVPGGTTDELKYQKPGAMAAEHAGELLTVKVRYKAPDGDVSDKFEIPVNDQDDKAVEQSKDFDFAASVAAFGMMLRDSEYKGQASYDLVLELAKGGVGEDAEGYRKEFVELVKKARELAPAPKK